MPAITNNQFTIMEEELYCRPSPRLLEGALKLGKMIHPEIYNDLHYQIGLQLYK